jgi:hypothetical protein
MLGPVAGIRIIREVGVMKLYSTLRRLVDWDLNQHHRPGSLSLLLGMLPWLGIVPISRWLDRSLEQGLIVIATVLTAVWLLFVVWRGWRLLRASILKSDRAYDRKGRFMLPPEYKRTISATGAKRQREGG